MAVTNKIDVLLSVFEKAVAEPWLESLSIVERMWFLVYDPEEHRKMMARLTEFDIAAKEAGKHWKEISLELLFPQWMAEHEYREEYFESPEAISDELSAGFLPFAREETNRLIEEQSPDSNTLLVIKDAASLFGVTRLSQILDGLKSQTKGRILVLFPGSYEANHYRLLNARDGWSYLARPLTI